jgi:hypothetical protein
MDMTTRTIGPDAAAAGQVSPVNSHNEWDPLEEVIVGRLEGATIPSGHPVVTCNIPGMAAWAQSLVAGCRYPKIMIEPAQRELDGFVALLQSLGIVVTRPEPAVSLLRDALLSSDPEGLFSTRRALDRRAQAATDERAVRCRVSRPRKRRADLLYPDRIRTGLRRRRFLSLRARPVRDPQQRNQCVRN